MGKQHHYKTTVAWTGNWGAGTTRYDGYDRNHTFSVENKANILCSSDAAFRGDGTRHNPEDMLVYSLSSCHMLWYLHLCADEGVIVTDYTDQATGTMLESPGGGGRFVEVTLHPSVKVKDASMIDKANELHNKAHEKCFIANSCNFPVKHEPQCTVG
jgi:organic hydroperoxide reductase OsmC/OhrA